VEGFCQGGIDIAATATSVAEHNINEAITKAEDNNPHLRSTKNMSGYSISATDGTIGEVEDFIIDDNTLQIRYLVVDTGKWFPGKKVIISPDWIKEIKWHTAEVIINATAEQVKNCPEYEPAQYISEEYEANLQNYYGRFITHK
jgi:sporulation protein YlmC with PRC-barrel domain